MALHKAVSFLAVGVDVRIRLANGAVIRFFHWIAQRIERRVGRDKRARWADRQDPEPDVVLLTENENGVVSQQKSVALAAKIQNLPMQCQNVRKDFAFDEDLGEDVGKAEIVDEGRQLFRDEVLPDLACSGRCKAVRV